MSEEFEREVIDRLARIETEIKRYSELDKRIAKLEESENQRKGKSTVIAAVFGFLGTIVGAVVCMLIGKAG